MRNLTKIFLLTAFSIPLISHSQDFNLTFRHLGEEEGLEHNEYNEHVKKDSRGFVWISSSNGIYRFDGSYLKHYPLNEKDEFGGMVQSSFFEDNNNNIWFTTYTSLQKYNRKSDQIESFQIKKGDLTIDYGYTIFHFNKKSNTLWMSSDMDSCIWTYHLKTQKSDFLPISVKAKKFIVDTLPSGKVNKIFAFPWDINKGFQAISKDESGNWNTEFKREGIFEDAVIRNGVIEGDSILWLFSNIGLIKYHYVEDEVKGNYPLHEDQSNSMINGLFAKKRHLLIATTDSGLHVFDTKKNKYTKHVSKNNSSLKSDYIYNICKDVDGQLWLALPSLGISYVHGFSLPIQNPFKTLGSSFIVKSITEDHHKRAWVLTQTQGIFVFDLSLNLLHHFKAEDFGKGFKNACLSISKTGNIFIGINKCIYSLSIKNDLKNSYWKKNYCGKNDIYSIYQGISGRLITIYKEGTFELIQKEANYFLSPIDEFKDYKKFEFRYWFNGSDSSTYIPFQQTDLWVLDHTGKDLFIKSKVPLRAAIFDIIQSKIGKVVRICTNKGVFQIDAKHKVDLIVGEKEFGENNAVFSLEEDDLGKLWLSTSNGIWSYEIDTKKAIKYTSTKGPPSGLNYLKGARLLASDGKIWFDTKEGLQVFRPNSMKLLRTISKAYIDNLWIDDKKYNGTIAINELDTLFLDFDQNILEFDLRTIDLNQIASTNLLYRLKNYQENWTRVKKGTVGFSTPPPGAYELEVTPIDSYNQLGPVKRLTIIVTIPFWRTLWFKAVFVFLILALGMAYFVRRFYHKKLQHQKRLLEKQKTLSEERDRIAKELHDDLGGELSSILFINDDMLLDEKDDSKKQHFERISELTQNALINMKDIIWALDNNQNEFRDLISRIRSYAHDFLSDHKISLDFNSNIEEKRELIFSSEKKRNILLIVKECLHNAVKHSGANKVKIEIIEDGSYCEILIQDNGIGFSINDIDCTGNGLSNMKHRGKKIHWEIKTFSSEGQGTKIRLRGPCN